MAKKKRRKSSRKSPARRRSSSRRAPARRRRSHGGGGVSHSLMPRRHELEQLGGTLAYGFLEGKAVADATFIMNSIPRPVAQLGYAGGIALALRVVNAFATKNKYVGLLAQGAAHAAMYQLGRLGKLPTSAAAPATLSGGENYLGDDEVGDYLDGETMGALEAEGEIAGDLDGDEAAVDGMAFMRPNPGT